MILLASMVTLMAMAQSPQQKVSSAMLSKPDRTPIAPSIPKANRHARGKIFLERADSLIAQQWMPDAQILVGNVMFRRGDMYMYCDSAVFYSSPTMPSDSMEAFGNIRCQQGDTLFLYGDWMEYSGWQQLASIYSNGPTPVRLINRDVTLTTDILHYDMGIDLGYFNVWGKLTDARNTLTSLEGEYIPGTKDANFYTDVKMQGVSEKGDSVWVYTDTLSYNTDTHLALLTCPSRILSKDGDIITSNGLYDSNKNMSWLYDRSTVHTNRGNTLTGDSLFYDRAQGYGEAFGAMVLTDSARQVTMEGDYGYYNELADSSYVTGRARAMEYSRADTLYLHAREIRSFLAPDSTHIMTANPRARFYRIDVQGMSDSMAMVEADSTLRMFTNPIVWSDNRQVFGNKIYVYFNDSTVERAWLPDFGFLAEHVDEDFFNQLSGKEMIAYFDDGHLKQLDVNGSVQAIMLPQENDSTYNKIANIESSYMIAKFNGKEMERALLWNETTGTVTPLYLAKRSLFRLPRFKWYDVLRPLSPDDIFRIPPEWDAMGKEF
jgi:lipopolysaccharide export system protein LptA